ncbi:MAG: DUF4230 domain-containing protein [Bacteroidaceae bacterium]|nr:DUF4230 domain-containing protein [Bacteroidaceae bacterium]
MLSSFRIVLVVLFALMLSLITSCSSCGSGDSVPEVAVQDYPDTITIFAQRVAQTSRIYTAEMVVRKIVTHEDKKHLSGKLLGNDVDIELPLSDRKIAVPIEYVVKGYIDLTGFSAANVSRNGNKIRITLPRPQVELTSSEIDYDEMKRNVSLFRSDFTDKELTELTRSSRKSLLKNLPKVMITEKAKASARNIMLPILRELGFEEAEMEIDINNE